MIEVTLKIDGMKCGMCESHVNDLARRVPGVKKATSSHAKGEAVIIAEDNVSVESLKEAISKDGYRVLSEESKPYVKKGFFSFLKK